MSIENTSKSCSQILVKDGSNLKHYSNNSVLSALASFLTSIQSLSGASIFLAIALTTTFWILEPNNSFVWYPPLFPTFSERLSSMLRGNCGRSLRRNGTVRCSLNPEHKKPNKCLMRSRM